MLKKSTRKKNLVTGGAGFIGSYLVDRLLERGEEVVCVDNFLLGKKEYLIDALKNKSFQLHEFDLLDLDTLDCLFHEQDFDMVYHLAANSDIQAGCNRLDIDLKNTFLTTFNILSCMKNYEVEEILFASSSAIYGNINEVLQEDTGPLFPISNYGAAKLASEAYISAFCESCNMKAWIIRFPNVVGRHLTHGVIYDFLNRLEKDQSELLVLGDGKQQKPYLYIDDLINAMECIYKKTNKKINCFNVASTGVTSVKEIVEIVLHKLGLENTKVCYGKETRGWIGDIPRFEYDTSKVCSLNWQPNMSSNEAVMLSVEKELEYRSGTS